MAKENITIRMEPETVAKMDAVIEIMGINRSEFMTEAVQLFLELDKDWTLNKAKEYAEGLKTTEGMVLQNMFIKYLAQVQAVKNVWGEYQGFMGEFVSIHDDKGARMLTGQELFDFLVKQLESDEAKKKKQSEEWKNIEKDK